MRQAKDLALDKSRWPASNTGNANQPRGVRIAIWRSRGEAYLLAALLTLVTLIIRLAVIGRFEEEAVLNVFLIPIIFSAYLGGLGPGLAATTFSALVADYYLLTPAHNLLISGGADRLEWLLLVITGVLISGLTETLHRSRLRDIANERQHKVTLESIGDAVITTDNRGYVTFLNGVAEQMTGWRVSEARHRPLSEVFRIVNEQTRQAVDDPVSKVLGCGAVVGMANHTILISRDGREIPINDSGAPIKRDDGTIIGVVLVFRDCTEEKKAEAALRDSMALYYSLVEQMPVGVFRKDAAGRYVLVNSWFCQFGNFKPEQYLGRTVEEFSAELAKNKVNLLNADVAAELSRLGGQHHASIMRTGKRIELEEERRLVDDRKQYLQVVKSPVFDSTGKIIGSQGVLFDITQRKEAETALHDSMALYHSLVDQIPAGLFRKDAAGRYVFVNSWFCRLKGVKAELFLGKKPEEVAAIELAAGGANSSQINRLATQGMDHHQQIMRTGRPIEVEEHGLGPDGKEQHVQVIKSPVFDSNGKIIGSQGILFEITERKQMEETLAQERSLLRTLIDNLPDCIYAKDTAGRKTLANLADYKNYHCKTEAEAIGKTDFDLFPKDVAEKFWADDQKVIGGQLVVNQEEYFLNEKGEKRWLLTSKLPLRDPGGKIVGLVGIGRDITDRRYREDHFKQLTDCFLSFGADPVENINRMTALCGKLLGATCALYNRLEGGLLCSLGRWNTPPDFEPKCKPEGHICYDVIRKGGDDLFVIKNLPTTSYFKSDPHVAHYQLKTYLGKAVRFSNVAVGSLCCVYQDDYEPDPEARRIITIIAAAIGIEENRLQAREKLRKREESYHALADNVPDAVTRIDRNMRLLYVNRALEEALHLPAAAMLGKTNVELNLPARNEWNQATQAVFESGKPQDFEFEASLSDGIHHLEVRLVPERSTTGQVELVLAVTRDVTERKKLEAQLRQSQKMDAIGQLAGGVAHDFNNMLTVIQGNASMLLNPQLNVGEQKESAQQIVRAAERAAGLTRQLLLFSRKQVMQATPLNLNEAVGNMTKMLQRILGEDISLNASYTGNLPVVLADPGMIEQILLNLAVNSRDAMPKGGQLTINTSVETLDKSEAKKTPGASPGLYACLNVADTGCGIAPENLSRIFEPFFTTKEAGKGTGLGLATVYGIVQQHHGWIAVNSQVGQGTSFRIYLPAAKDLSAKSSAVSIASKLPGGNETILLVEDEPPVRLLASNLLQRCGYTVLVAESGAAALPVWKEHREKIHLLLTDMVMPEGISGRELAEKLTADRPGLKVIYTSGYSADLIGREPPLIEGRNFLQKPYHPLKLAQIIRNCLDQKLKS